MKKAVKTFIITVALILTFVGLNIFEHNYTRPAEVKSVDNEVVSFVDDWGLVWEWELEEGEHFTKGEKVELKMNDNCTTKATDDIITRVVIK